MRVLSCFSPAMTNADTSFSDGIGISRTSPSLPHASIYFTSKHQQQNTKLKLRYHDVTMLTKLM